MTLSSRYTLNAKIRETARVEVYRGFRKSDGTPVLIKLLRSERPSPLEIARIRHEHGVLESLDIPEAVKALALERHGHGLALVMEDAGEVSVDKLIRSGYLDPRRSLELAVAMARVVAAVHGKRIIHKDIKPEHFLVRGGAQNSLVLVDFGIATRLSEQVETLSPVTELEGTLAYIAPEQTGRLNRVVDARADLYSLGVSLYELFTGGLPFDSVDPLELVHSHIARTPRPPAMVRADVPRPVSDLILKLLSKAVEHRYQSAAGVQHDLQRCLELLNSASLDGFEIAQRDRSAELSIPQKLYGRERELAALLEGLARAKNGGRELILLSGQAGAGKSALVDELRQQLLDDACFGAGKFDYLSRSAPYAPIASACRTLVRSVLAEPPGVLTQHRRAILDAVGANGALLVDLVQELGLVIGEQPEVPALGPSESQHRFERVFLGFLRVFATGERPLVLFMDDLQWADPGSLRLLQRLLAEPEAHHVLIVAAYRDGEVDAAHPLSIALQELRQSGASMHEVILAPLAPEHVTQLLRETLGAPPKLSELSAVLFEKTGGNPFFVAQFLTTLYRDRLLWLDQGRREWDWDLARVRGRLATDNVIEFMLSELKRLPEETQGLLRLAACIGHQFDARTLAVVAERPLSEVAGKLWEALRQGYIVPLDGNYRYTAGPEADSESSSEAAPNATYRFQHDRVQQAAYSLMTAEAQAAAHSRIGRWQLARSDGRPSDHELFEITDHLNRGARLISDPAEQRELARLNLAAGQKARAAAAPDAAVHYLSAALERVGEDGWSTDYELVCSAHLVRAECEYLTGNLDTAFQLLRAVEQNARTVLDRVRGRNLEVLLLTNTGQLHAACSRTVEALELLGCNLPPLTDKAALGAAIGADFQAYQAILATQAIESLSELPRMTDPTELALLETLATGIPPAFQSLPELHVLLVLKGVQLLTRAIAPSAGFFSEQYAIVHLVITGHREDAYRFGRLGLALATSTGSAATKGQVHFLFGGFIVHWREHISRALELLRAGLRLSLELGDQIYAAYCATFVVHYRLYAGENLRAIEDSLKTARELAERTGDVVNQGFCRAAEQEMLALTGRTRHAGTLESEGFEEAAFLAAAPPPALAMYGVAKATVQYFAGHFREALATCDQCKPVPGCFYHAEIALYRALSLAELAHAANQQEQAALMERLRAEAATLEAWAQSAPANHAHRAALVQAEIARIERRTMDALDAYDQAIALAQQHGFTQAEALANELSGRYLLERQKAKLARVYLSEAVYAYQRWGASSKVDELRAKYSQVLTTYEAAGFEQVRAASLAAGGLETATTMMGTVHSGGSLDLTAAIRATEAISTELVVDRLLERLMRTLLGSAGAQRGWLILDREGTLTLQARMTIEPDELQLEPRELQGSSEVPETLVRYVARTRELTALSEPRRDARFASDPYFSRVHPKSVLCVPMLQRGKLTGVLYLENFVTAEAFSPGRSGLLQFLGTQAAVALENSMLYGRLDAASQEMRRANENLEALVAERTAELRRLLGELWSEMDLARKIQTVLLPKQISLSHYEIAALMMPADSVGGDYYDVLSTSDNNWVLMGDVSGHGVTAGLIMMMVQTAVRTILTTTRGQEALCPATVLSRANLAVRDNLKRISPDQYMTIVALELGPGRIRYAGLHQDILIYRARTNTIDAVETRGMWIGVEDDIAELLANDTITLETGDTVLLYTDGITESKSDGVMLETRGLAARFHALATQGLESSAIVKGMVGPLAGQQLRDDVTVMALRYLPDRKAKAAE